MGLQMNRWVTRSRQAGFFARFSSKCSAFPSLDHSLSLSFSLLHIYFHSPLTLTDSPSAPQRPLTDAGLTDLPPQSHHWLPAWQSWFNARFWLVQGWQANLWPRCDSTLAVFDVSYRSVAYGTQKRCQVSIVKSSPQGKVHGVLNIPDVREQEGRREKEAERWFVAAVIFTHSGLLLWNAFAIKLKNNILLHDFGRAGSSQSISLIEM